MNAAGIKTGGNTFEKRRTTTRDKNDYISVKRAGLTKSEVEKNRRLYGTNDLTKRRQDGFVKKFLKSFNDPIIRILLAALIINAAVSLGRINIPETVGIAAAILISTLVSTISEYSSSKAFERLCKNNGSECSVRRDGKTVKISQSDIVVGDTVILHGGMSIPADGILTEGCIFADQSALTGESIEREKTAFSGVSFCPDTMEFSPENKHQLFAGSGICRGEGEMTVLRTGDKTFLGEVAGSLQETSRPSPLKHRLGELAKSISYLGYVGAFMIAFAFLFNSFVIESGMNMSVVSERLADKQFLFSEILRSVTVAVSVIVVAVPEGLPMMVTVVLSSNMKKMLRAGVLVRRLVGIETAGSLNILFTDKTGTLTSGKMKVKNIVSADLSVSSYSELKKYGELSGELCNAVFSACFDGGSSTEKALLGFFPTMPAQKPGVRLPFDSKRKYSAGVLGKNSYFVGAPEKLIALSDSFLTANGESMPLTQSRRDDLINKMRSHAQKGTRVVCAATGEINTPLEEPSHLTFICFAGLSDPVRAGVRESVKEAQGAGIHVVMITGDSVETAKAIAAETAIMTKNGIVIDAQTLHNMSDDEVKLKLPDICVVSRALPSDKIRLVKLSQEAGLVTGMTGDGINDAPALKAADVGFSMGSGTDIAKEAGDIVITDDSFASITRAVLYGRTIFESIRKFIVFQLMMNLSATGISLVGPFIGVKSPVTVIQMLWVNIIMDTLGGLAFAGEPALKKYMRQKSIPRNAKIISGKMMNQIIITGLYTLTLSIVFLKSPAVRKYFGGNETYFLTAFFAMFIFCGIFNSFNARTDKVNILSHLAGNKPFILIMTAVAAVQLLMIYFGGEVFRCHPLSPKHLMMCALIASSVIPADMIRKKLFSKKYKQ